LLRISRGPPELVLVGDGVANAGGVAFVLVGVAAADSRREETVKLVAET
jgi:hypothetical protein